MRRREFITLLGSAAAWPLAARAQQTTKVPRISILSPGRSELPDPNFNMLNAFLQGLQELGYADRQNVAIERHYADGSSDGLRELAAELVRHRPDIIVAFSTTAARPVKHATGTIPIVAVAMADPVEDELRKIPPPPTRLIPGGLRGPGPSRTRISVFRRAKTERDSRIGQAHQHDDTERRYVVAGVAPNFERVPPTDIPHELAGLARIWRLQACLGPSWGPHTNKLLRIPRGSVLVS